MVTKKQLSEMRHALGLDDEGKGREYRNYFCTYGNDKDWDALVSKGLAIVRPFAKGLLPKNGLYYHLTEEGKKIAREGLQDSKIANDGIPPNSKELGILPTIL